MAFQTGSQVRPELADADYSGFQNAASIQANAMANFGESIASGIKGYKKKKKDDKIGQAKINRSIAFGESMIEMLGEDHPLSNSIADSLAMNFGANVPFDQAVAATDGLSDTITNMFLMNQQSQGLTTMMTPSGTELLLQGGKVVGKTTPYQMGGNPYGDLINTFSGVTTPTTPTTPIPAAPTPDDLEEEARLLREQGLTQ